MTGLSMDARLRIFISSTRKRGDSVPFFPLCLGVSGHRKIEELALNKVRCVMVDFLLESASEWRRYHRIGVDCSGETPVLLLCGLALGADILAAQEILRLKLEHPELNYKLVAVLPMPLDHYKEDFSKESDREIFYELIQKADCVLDLPLTPENQCWSNQHPEEKLPLERRISQYDELAKFLASNSTCLLALWDGLGINLDCGQMTLVEEGGTAEVVYRKLKNCLETESDVVLKEGFDKETKDLNADSSTTNEMTEAVLKSSLFPQESDSSRIDSSVPISLDTRKNEMDLAKTNRAKAETVKADLAKAETVLASDVESSKILSLLLSGSVVQIATPRRKRGQVQLAPGLVPGEIWGYVRMKENIGVFRWTLPYNH